MPSKLETALALAQQGFYVFPCNTNRRDTSVSWPFVSTRDPAIIRSWFFDEYLGLEQDPNIGIDCGKSGKVGLDVDCKNGKHGKESLKTFIAEFGALPPTLIVKTPSGGLHIYFNGDGYSNSVEKLAPGLDIRAKGGYLVAPGSIIDGVAYEMIIDRAVADLPEWLASKLQKHSTNLTKDGGKVASEDRPDDIAWAIGFLNEHPGAVEGAGGDTDVYVTICKLKESGIGKDTAKQLLEEYWMEKCSRPWENDWINTKLNNAYRSAQNATGILSPHVEFEPPAEFKKPSLILPDHYSTGYRIPAESSIPARDWIFGDMALAKQVSLLISQPGVGKSTFNLSAGLSKVTGKNLLGIDPRGAAPVAIFNNEDNMEEQSRRLVAAAKYHGITNDDLNYPDVTEKGSMFFLNSGEKSPLRIVKRGADGRLKADQVDIMISYLLKYGIRWLIVDPLAETHTANENSNEEMMQVGAAYRYIAQQADCAVTLTHHTRKISGASAEGHSGNMDSARGASSLLGIVRIAHTLDGMSEQEAKRTSVRDDDRRHFVVLEQAKANMSAPGQHKRYFRRHGELLNVTPENIEGESVGVLLPVNIKKIARENSSPALQILIGDIESLVKDNPMSVSDIAEALVNTGFAMHGGKHVPTLKKAIYRLFDTGVLTGLTGKLNAVELPQLGKRPITMISFEPDTTA